MYSETEIINLANRYFHNYNEHLIKGIGDDTAVFTNHHTKYQLFTSDMLVENTHFLFDKISPYNLGWKTLAVNISDIASMGGIPEYALISLGLNKKANLTWLEEFYKGLSACSEKYHVSIIGGDTVASKKTIILNIALLGYTHKAIYRNNIKEGYILTSTGNLGFSGAGLWLLKNNSSFDNNDLFCIEKHVKPIPRVTEGIFINENLEKVSMMDSSDGLYISAKTLCEQSSLGLDLYKENLVIAEEVKKVADKALISPLDFILYGGEDYELIFALPEKDFYHIKENYYKMFNFELKIIGKFTENKNEIRLIDKNSHIILKDKSFKHF